MKIVSVTLASFVLIACDSGNDSPSSEDARVQVYIDDGAVQCESIGLSPASTAQGLIDIGIDVIDSTCGYLTGVEAAALCGLSDTNINIHTIPIQNLPDAIEIGYENTASLSQGYTTTCD